MATIGTILYTAMHGKPVGQDEFGNKYYEAKSEKTSYGIKKRWVIYKGKPEASKVPASWHGWLHYTSNEMPSTDNKPKYNWLKQHLPNLTGTKLAYLPDGDINSGNKRAHTMADYEAWKPN
ncbi:MAG: NADH:ubiquinone oxidoreductase subunit NDUFA12 [Pseudomonadota bacterium]